MTLNGKITYHKALVLTPERIYELESILKKHCDKVTYEATTVSGVEIAFENVEELVGYENFEKKRIKDLTVFGYKNYSRVFRVSFEYSLWWFKSRGYDDTCTCLYTLNSLDDESIFSSDFKNYLKKSTARYWVWGKLSLIGIIWPYSCLLTSYNYFTGKFENVTIDGASLLLAIVIAVLFISGVGAFDRLIIRNVFPPMAYLWGEEKDRQGRLENLRNNLLWTVIIGGLMSLVLTYITHILFG